MDYRMKKMSGERSRSGSPVSRSKRKRSVSSSSRSSEEGELRNEQREKSRDVISKSNYGSSVTQNKRGDSSVNRWDRRGTKERDGTDERYRYGERNRRSWNDDRSYNSGNRRQRSEERERNSERYRRDDSKERERNSERNRRDDSKEREINSERNRRQRSEERERNSERNRRDDSKEREINSERNRRQRSEERERISERNRRDDSKERERISERNRRDNSKERERIFERNRRDDSKERERNRRDNSKERERNRRDDSKERERNPERNRRDDSKERERNPERNRRDNSKERERISERNRRDDSKERERNFERNRRDRRGRSEERISGLDFNRRDARDRRNYRPRSEERSRGSNDRNPNRDTRKKTADVLGALTTRTGGAYIPPAKLRMLQSQISDKSSAEYQRISWEALKKSIHGLINKINTNNIGIIVRELFRENVVRGRGLLSRSIMQAQAFSPTFTHVYAALTGIINSKFPETGELILRRLIVLFRRSYRRNDKQLCMTSARFIGHLVNQQVAHELVALEILTLLLENPTDDSVEVAIGFLKECGMKLTEVTPRGIHSIFDRLRGILHEGQLDKRVQYMIEVMFAVRKDGFKDHPSVLSELDLVEENDQYTHLITLEEATNPDDILNVFKFDPEYEVNEQKYAVIRKEILDESSSGSEDGGSGSESEEGDDEDGEEGDGENQEIIDSTETNLIALRRTIYLTIQSSLDFEECAHKLLKLELKPGEIIELCHMILDCCAQQRTYEKFYGLLGQRFCQLNKVYVEPFQEIFKSAYDTIHRFETNKLRNVGKFFAHLLYTDAISWLVLSNIRLNEEETTSSSRIFIKILFQELCEYMGLPKLNDRVKDATLQEAFDGIFPRDNPRNTRFAINFFTSIGLGGLTDDLREHLKNIPKPTPVPIVTLPDNSSSDESIVEIPKQKPKHKKKKKKQK